MIGCGMLLKSSRQFVGECSQEDRDVIGPLSKQTRQLTTEVILLLSGILILCILLHIITLHIIFYKKQETLQDLWAWATVADEMMFVKVASDAFIYAPGD